ncbi:TRAP transporter small permease [Thalassococcus sp. S3]|uniref:TRAP transporter small permease n=1 Tax=Thalassococcus sp. S3 TaxID=2017482 RepID=UPI0010241849|nr:TRAP transporter small permease [Thalassococcus sp. S3]QBF33872.1 C4-dicarboxylate ABC transporter permease [Thalassococcus sp. S3]
MHSFMMGLARVMAVLGGIVLTALILLTCLSILGRSLNGVFHSDFMEGIAPGFSQWALNMGVGPINGDFELVEAGVAFAIFAFIPLCQITMGHAAVDIFANQLPRWFDRIWRVVIEVVFAAVLILIAVQLYDGMQSKMRYGETTFLIQFPIWWAYAASLVGAVVSAIVGTYLAVMRLVELVSGRQILPEGAGAEH